MNPTSPRQRGPLAPWACRLMLMALVLFASAAGAQVPVPPLTARVTDQTGTLTQQQRDGLEERLAAFEARKGSQLAVLVVPTTAPEPIEEYALRVAEQWKLGRRNVDDAAILVVAKDDRAVRIEVGYGLEGVLSAAPAGRIIREAIVPRFREQDYAGGIAAGVERMMSVIDGEPLPPPPESARSPQDEPTAYLPMVIVAALAIGAVLRGVLGRARGALATGGLVGVAAWWFSGALSLALAAGVLAVFVALFGGLGLIRMGGLGGGGRRGDGFRGGGGGFGGGGASGRW